MDSPPPPYKKSASVSRSNASQNGLGATADDLLRAPVPRSVSSASSIPHGLRPPATPLAGASPSRDDIGTTTDAMLRASLSRSLSKTSMASASVSRSKASNDGLGATAEAWLRSPVPRSVSAPFLPVTSTSASMSRSSASQSGLGATAEAMLRTPLPRSVSSPAAPLPPASVSPSAASSVSTTWSWASSVSSGASQPPSYHTSERARPRPPIVGSAPGVVPARPVSPRAGRSDIPWPPSISAAESKRRVRQMHGSVEKASAAAPARNTEGLFKAVCSTDLLFLMDTTGSMKKYIKAAKDQVTSIMAGIQRAYLGESTVRVAVVGYKDHCDSPNVEFLDFTTSMDEARAFLGNLRAGGGEGWTADALGGIRQASHAAWMQPTRCIIHIADAPAHSRALHDMSEAKDNKYYRPGSEPHGLTYDPVIRMLVKLSINYTFLHIHHCTDRMVLAFSGVYDAAGADRQLLAANKYYDKTSARTGSKVGGSSMRASRCDTSNSLQLLFRELPLGIDIDSLQCLVLKSVTDSVTRTSGRHSMALAGSRMSAGNANAPKKRSHLPSMLSAVREDEDDDAVDVHLEKGPPQWNSPGWLNQKWDLEGYCPEVVVYSDSTLADMMASDENIKLSFAQLTVHARSTPFGQGAQRVASYARIAASTSRLVIKSFTGGGKGLEHLIEDMRMQAMCKAFALEFNGLVRPEQWIDFVVTACLQSKTDAASARGASCVSLEPYLPGEYVKYNNNGLYVREDSPSDSINRVAQAFSHFTFERSWGHFMVVDLQGVGNLLTDPAIHTLDPNRFKLNDLNCSSEGFKCFFAMHGCNEVCHQLGLVSNRDMCKPGAWQPGDWQFRQQWPSIDPTVCCSNKFCQSIIRLHSANMSTKFPGYRWCSICWPQLQATTVRWMCAAPGDTHEFDVSRFFYVSQGKVPPHKCPEHVDKDTTATSTTAVGAGLWSQMKSKSKRTSILGNEY